MISQEKRYLFTAIFLMRTHYSLFLLPLCFFIIAYLPLAVEGRGGSGVRESWLLLSIAGNVVLFVLYPIVYGLFIDIAARRRRRSWSDILRTDWWNFFVVSIVLGAPVFLIARFDPFPDLPFNTAELLVTLFSQWLSIYSVPLVFFTRRRLASIALGYKCLVGNLYFNRYLTGLTAITVVLNYSALQASDSATTAQRGLLGLFVIAVTMTIDLAVFIAATLILEEKFFRDPRRSPPQPETNLDKR
jgi:hypothetical protein